MNDYYATLGVARDASTEEIKRAYRKLVRELHPDVAGPGADEQIKAVNQAYEVLSNPDKRRAYDMGADPYAPGGGAGFGGAGFGFADIFETFFGQATGAPRGPVPRQRRGQDALMRVDIDLSEAAFGAERTMEVDTAVVCPTCSGSCCRPGTSPVTCTTCSGRGIVQRQARSLLGPVITTAQCSACQGFGTTIPDPCPECSGDGRVRTRRSITVKIPAGVDTGTRIRLTGQGEVGPAGGPAGDLFVEIRERKHPMFLREGDDLHCTINLPMTAAALGTIVTLETLDGTKDVDVHPGVQPGERVSLKGMGVGHLNSSGRGDLHMHVEVDIPTRLDEEQAELLRQLAQLRGEEHPEARVSPAHPGVFSRLKDMFAGR